MLNEAILNKSVLTKLSISIWSARKVDRNIMKEIVTQYGANSKQVTFAKMILDKERFADLREIASAARRFHYDSTLPWDAEGYSLLVTDRYAEYEKKINEFKTEFEAKVDKFIENYEQYIEEDTHLLGDLADKMDYPPASELKKKFKFAYNFMPVPHNNDFRLQLPDDLIEIIKSNFSNSVNDKLKDIKEFIVNKLYVMLTHAIDRLSDQANWFKDVTITNITDFASEIPKINITNDIKITEYGNTALKILGNVTPDTLRDDPIIRENVCNELTELANKILQSGDVNED